jgi:hypothetical protein
MRLGNHPLVLRAAETLLLTVHTITFLAPRTDTGTSVFRSSRTCGRIRAPYPPSAQA